MWKTALMLLGLASVFGASIACFGLFSSRSHPGAAPAADSCDGLEAQARRDCEQRRSK